MLDAFRIFSITKKSICSALDREDTGSVSDLLEKLFAKIQKKLTLR